VLQRCDVVNLRTHANCCQNKRRETTLASENFQIFVFQLALVYLQHDGEVKAQFSDVTAPHVYGCCTLGLYEFSQMSSFPELTTTSTPQASGPRTNASHLLVSRTARLQCTRTIIVAYDSLYIVITAAAPHSQPTAMYTASPKAVHLLCLRSNSSQTSADLDSFFWYSACTEH